MKQEIRVYWGKRDEEGSCNICQTRELAEVLTIRLPTMSFRVCRLCLLDLMEELSVAVGDERVK